MVAADSHDKFEEASKGTSSFFRRVSFFKEDKEDGPMAQYAVLLWHMTAASEVNACAINMGNA